MKSEKKLYVSPTFSLDEMNVEQGIAASGVDGVNAESFTITDTDESYW